MNKKVTCPCCKGHGSVGISYGNQFFEVGTDTCTVCNGTGSIEVEERDGQMFVLVPLDTYVSKMEPNSEFFGYFAFESAEQKSYIERICDLQAKGYSMFDYDDFVEADKSDKEKESSSKCFDKYDEEYL